MGILDQVLGGMMGGGANSPMGNVLSSLLAGGMGGGQQGGQPGYQGTGYQGGMQGNPMMGGGLGGLLSAFQQAGLGHIAQSWVGSGPNQPVSPDQLQQVFGQQQVQQMAGQAGMAPNDFLSQLSQHLPRAVDGMTPNGQVQNEGTVSV
ncbi:MAG: DUF937 domain-containing protein [Acetobacteraceae bacterium]|nr:DUF937 domain-containing protein [Acetobacteraceae bacterium]